MSSGPSKFILGPHTAPALQGSSSQASSHGPPMSGVSATTVPNSQQHHTYLPTLPTIFVWKTKADASWTPKEKAEMELSFKRK